MQSDAVRPVPRERRSKKPKLRLSFEEVLHLATAASIEDPGDGQDECGPVSTDDEFLVTPSGEPFSASSEEGDGIVEAEGTANGEAEQTSLNAPKILFEDDGEQHEERHNNSQREEAPEVQPSLDNVTLVTCRNAESSVFSDKHGPKGRVLRIRDWFESMQRTGYSRTQIYPEDETYYRA